MQATYEEQYHRIEGEHAWFRARRQIVRQLVAKTTPNRAAQVLEIGCSSGLLIRQLQDDGYSHISGIDISATAIERCRAQGLDKVQVMDAQELEFADQMFDVITASDVLEHLADANRAVQEWWRTLKPGGSLIIFVPAFQFLWSEHDVANKHFRRYRRKELAELIRSHGFTVERSSYWNFSTFAPLTAVRFWQKWRPPARHRNGHGDLFLPPVMVNRVLLGLFGLENRWMKLGGILPFGVSAMVIGRKGAASRSGSANQCA
jgi:ubiquinone/menaquinone biosynthesis C-methylase UbiE